jgi:hypothetical protein
VEFHDRAEDKPSLLEGSEMPWGAAEKQQIILQTNQKPFDKW